MKPTSLQIIGEAYERGDLDYETALVNKVHALLAPTKLDERFKVIQSPPVKCATPIFLEISENWTALSKKTRATLQHYLLRPSEGGEDGDYAYTTEPTFYDSHEGHFRIWYVTTTADAPSPDDVDPSDGIPDYINRCAAIFDNCWNQEVNSMGYLAPPHDGPWYPTTEDYGGDSKYDIYVADLGSNLYGYTAPEYKVSGGNTNAMTSYIVIDNDYDGFGYPDPIDPLKVTAAHEFFHAIHFAYDAFEDVYFMEISSTWMEDVIYDGVNDYLLYLNAFFRFPEVSLTNTNGLHEYASCIWAHYVTERFHLEIMRQFWIECGLVPNKNSLNAFQTVLSSYGTSREEAFKDFTVWNYFTGDRADSNHYSEGALWPQVHLHTSQVHDTYPVSVTNPPLPPQRWGSNYIRFSPNLQSSGLRIDLDGSEEVTWGAGLVAYRDTGAHAIAEMDLDEGGQGSIDIPEWYTYSKIILIPNVTTPPSSRDNNYVYSYAAEQMEISNAAVPKVRAGSDDSGEAGREVIVYFFVKNISVIPSDTFRLTLSETENWQLNFSPSSVFLEPGEESIVVVTVTIPEGSLIGMVDTLTLTATSHRDSSSADSGDLNVTVRQSKAGNPEVTARDDTTTTPGSSIPLFFTIRNCAPAYSDSFAVFFEDEFEWTAIPDSLHLCLASGTDTTVQTDIHIPGDVSINTQNIISCTALSLHDRAKRDSDSVTVTIEAPRATVSVENGYGLPGSSHNGVDLLLNSNTEIWGMSFSLFEDTQLLTATNVFPVARAESLSLNFVQSPGQLLLELTTLSGQSITPGDGPIIRIEYAVVDSVEVGQLIHLNPSGGAAETPYGIPVPVEFKGSTFSVCRLPGDVNGDETVDLFDIVSLIDIILDIGEHTPLERCAADCNHDGSIGILDVISILHKVL
ncbi:MAG: dockerin type I repeat-containing protein [Gemmatimonadota bacterium]|nr:MAG: dockerin type I repeat-containing protein [Gemmatimonadota bacterium]